MDQRRHYLTLDALRGVAAFAVMIYHQQHAAVMGHGYLAVDFFFILSGFVIAKAYEHQLLETMSFLDFAIVRFARLYPLLIAATLVATAYMVMTSLRSGGDLRAIWLLPAALVALPDPSATFAPDPFPLLPVVWSLFFEIFANLLYGLRPDWLSTSRLMVVLLVSAVMLIFALNQHGNGELGNTYATLWAGIPRVTLSFFGGVVLFRLHAQRMLPRPKVSPLVLAVVLLATLAMPHEAPWLYDALCIFLVFPLILVAAISNEPATGWSEAARFSANASYPLYLLHLPLMLWIGFVLAHFGLSPKTQHLVELVAVPALAYAAFVTFDRPVQKALKKLLANDARQFRRLPEAPAL